MRWLWLMENQMVMVSNWRNYVLSVSISSISIRIKNWSVDTASIKHVSVSGLRGQRYVQCADSNSKTYKNHKTKNNKNGGKCHHFYCNVCHKCIDIRFVRFCLISYHQLSLYVSGFIAEWRINRNSLCASHLYYNKLSIFVTDIPLSYRYPS